MTVDRDIEESDGFSFTIVLKPFGSTNNYGKIKTFGPKLNKYEVHCFKIYILIVFIISINNLLAIEKINHKIAVLVNDEIISTYDVTQRMKINAIISG